MTNAFGSSVHPDMRATFESHRIGIYSQVFVFAFALLLGLLQFSARLRAERPAIHRLIDRLYLGAGMVAWISWIPNIILAEIFVRKDA